MIELTERIGAKPVYRISPTEKINLTNMDINSKKKSNKDEKDNRKKKIATFTDDEKGENFDENI
jgi:hypothetical protein